MNSQHSPRTRWRAVLVGALFAVAGVTCLVVAALNSQLRLLALVCSLAAFGVAATALSGAARAASQLPLLAGRSVRIEVWGQPLEGGTALIVDSVRVLGAGLHIFLRSPTDTSSRDLKIAQPRLTQIADTRLEITEAAYVSWAGHKLTRDTSHQRPALLLSWAAA